MHDYVISLLEIADIILANQRKKLGLIPLNQENQRKIFTEEFDKLTKGVLDDYKGSFEAESNRRAIRYISVLEDFDKKGLEKNILEQVYKHSKSIFDNLYDLVHLAGTNREAAIEKTKTQLNQIYTKVSRYLPDKVLDDGQKSSEIAFQMITKDRLIDSKLRDLVKRSFGYISSRCSSILVSFKNIIKIANEHDVQFNKKKYLKKFTNTLPELLKHRDYMYELANKFQAATLQANS